VRLPVSFFLLSPTPAIPSNWPFLSEKQYKTQLKKWNFDTKYVKASEYMAMIKLKRERERGNPPKDTRFILRGRPVDPKDITRFEKRQIKKGKLHIEDDEDQGWISLTP